MLLLNDHDCVLVSSGNQHLKPKSCSSVFHDVGGGSEPSRGLQDLPDDLWLASAKYLHAQDLLNLAATCRRLRELLASSPSPWEQASGMWPNIHSSACSCECLVFLRIAYTSAIVFVHYEQANRPIGLTHNLRKGGSSDLCDGNLSLYEFLHSA